jgi:hypothetical protein
MVVVVSESGSVSESGGKRQREEARRLKKL